MEQTLEANHLSDLYNSGLTDQTIKDSGIRTILPDQFDIKLGWENGFAVKFGIESMYEIPYDESYSRYKIFYKEGLDKYLEGENKGKKKPKYLAKKGSVNRLYIPPTLAEKILQYPGVPLYITEGEKKALKAVQEGIECIAISGLWGWKVKERETLIDDFNKIDLKGRELILVPDSDYRDPTKNLEDAVNRLGFLLKKAKGIAFCMRLPESKDKVGLDDYLLTHSAEAFKTLRQNEILSLQEMISKANKDTSEDEICEISKKIKALHSEVEKDKKFGLLAKQVKVSKTVLKKEVIDSEEEDDQSLIYNAKFPGLIGVLIDKDGKTLYMIKKDGEILYEYDWKSLTGEILTPPPLSGFPFLLPKLDSVKKWYGKEDLTLYEGIESYFNRHCYLEPTQLQIVILYSYLTYLQNHENINYMPIILFHSVAERGKSRAGKAMIYISDRGIHIIEVREANLLRYGDDIRATLFFDMEDVWKKAEKSNSTDILQQRFEKGGYVARVQFPEKGSFKDMRNFEVYGSTIIATNKLNNSTFESRCLPITIVNNPGEFEDIEPINGLELKERLLALKAKLIDKDLPRLKKEPGINGRLWDVSKPLLQVCEMIKPESLQQLTKTLIKVDHEKREALSKSTDGQIIKAIFELTEFTNEEPFEWEIKSSYILEEINKNRTKKYELSAIGLGLKLKTLGIKTKAVDGKAVTCLVRKDFDLLAEQYGLIETGVVGSSRGFPEGVTENISLHETKNISTPPVDSLLLPTAPYQKQENTEQNSQNKEKGDEKEEANYEDEDVVIN